MESAPTGDNQTVRQTPNLKKHLMCRGCCQSILHDGKEKIEKN
jgi:hypothetical protein